MLLDRLLLGGAVPAHARGQEAHAERCSSDECADADQDHVLLVDCPEDDEQHDAVSDDSDERFVAVDPPGQFATHQEQEGGNYHDKAEGDLEVGPAEFSFDVGHSSPGVVEGFTPFKLRN